MDSAKEELGSTEKKETLKQKESIEKIEPTKKKESDKELARVINVKVSNIRPKYKDLRDWCEEKGNVYIGRRGVVLLGEPKRRYPPSDSVWANKFKISKTCKREDVVKLYEDDIRKKLKQDKMMVGKLLELKGKNLGCWCAPELCHGNVLQKLLKEYENYPF